MMMVLVRLPESDRIAVYQNRGKISNELIFEIQRRNNIVDTWIVKRNTIGVSSTTPIPTISTTSSAYSNNNDPTLINNPKKEVYKEDDNNNKTSRNIMIIDDEQDLLVAFKTILSTEGYFVETFSNPKEALR